jgi:hypothetical protein
MALPCSRRHPHLCAGLLIDRVGEPKDAGSVFTGRIGTNVLVDALDLVECGFERTSPAHTGRPGYEPAVLLKLFIYGYLNRVPSSRRLEREAGRNVELMWLTGRLSPDHKTIAHFRRFNASAIR